MSTTEMPCFAIERLWAKHSTSWSRIGSSASRDCMRRNRFRMGIRRGRTVVGNHHPSTILRNRLLLDPEACCWRTATARGTSTAIVPRSPLVALALAAALACIAACQAKQEPAPLPIPPRGSVEYPQPEEPKEDEAKPAVPEACKHVWTADHRAMHQFTVAEDGVPVVKLCTPIVCSKCGAVRHECMKELRRRDR